MNYRPQLKTRNKKLHKERAWHLETDNYRTVCKGRYSQYLTDNLKYVTCPYCLEKYKMFGDAVRITPPSFKTLW